MPLHETAASKLAAKRKTEIQAIMASARQLGYDTADKDESSEWRCLLWGIVRHRSVAALTQAQRHTLLNHLREAGAEHPNGYNPKHRKLAAIDGALMQLKQHRKYAEGIATQMGYRCANLNWLTADQLQRVNIALQKQIRREA